MSLDVSLLKNKLNSLFNSGTIDVASAAHQWADALTSFASTGTVNGSPVIISPAVNLSLVSIFTSLFLIVPDTPLSAAQQISAATDLMWVQAIVVGQIGPFISVGGLALTATLTGIFSVASGDSLDKSNQISNAFLTHAQTVTVPFAPPGTSFPVM